MTPTGSSAGSALGGILGGVLTSEAGWRWVFAINVPIGADQERGDMLALTRQMKMGNLVPHALGSAREQPNRVQPTGTGLVVRRL